MKNKTYKFILYILYILTLLLIIYSSLDIVLGYLSHRRSGLASMYGGTRTSMNRFASCLKEYLRETDDDIPTTMPELLMELIPYYSRGEILRFFPIDLSSMTFRDSWGNPIQIKVKSPSEYILISYGANERDDNGNRDDLTEAVNPLELRDRSEANDMPLLMTHRARIQVHLRTFTRISMQQFANYIQLYARDTNEDIPTTIDDLIIALSPYDSGIILYDSYVRSRIYPRLGKFRDLWDNPIQLKVKSPYEYIFISCGPNKIDDNGDGDDITLTFNPLKLRHKYDANEANTIEMRSK